MRRTSPSSLDPPSCVHQTWTPSQPSMTSATRDRWWRCSSKTKPCSSEQRPGLFCSFYVNTCLNTDLLAWLIHVVRKSTPGGLADLTFVLFWVWTVNSPPHFCRGIFGRGWTSMRRARSLFLCSCNPACVQIV